MKNAISLQTNPLEQPHSQPDPVKAKAFSETIRRALKRSLLLRIILAPALAIRRIGLEREEEALERAYQRLFQRVEGGSLIVRVPDFQGSFEIDGRSNLLKRILKRGGYEPDLVRTMLKHLDPMRDAIDIGANIGFFTVFLAKNLQPGRRVLSVEPAPLALKYLHGNIERNQVGPAVVLFEGVAMNEEGSFNLHVVPGKEEYSSVFNARDHVSRNPGGEEQTQLRKWMEQAGIADSDTVEVGIRGEKIDKLVEHHGLEPGFIKIDAEGAEYQVLQSALQTLTRYRPVILSELADILLAKSGVTSKVVIRLLQEHGYEVLDAEAPGRSIGEFVGGTILAVPRGGDFVGRRTGK